MTSRNRPISRPRASMVAAMVIVASLLTGCSAPRKPYACDAIAADPSVEAGEIWDCNREIMVRIVKGKKFTLREFSRAATFFEGVTGIPADVGQESPGPLPGDGLKRNLAQWDAWYTDNGARLRWNADRGVVEVAPEP